MQDEQSLQRVDDLLILCHLTFGTEGHLQEVSNVAKARVWLHHVLTLKDSQACGSDGRHLPNHTMNVDIPLLLRLVAELTPKVGRIGLGMARRKTGHKSLQHAHWMRILQFLLLIGLDETFKLLVDRVVLSET